MSSFWIIPPSRASPSIPTQSFLTPINIGFFSEKQQKFQSKKDRYKLVHFNRMTESPEATVSFKKCGKQLLWKWKVRGSCCDLCADQAGRGGPVYFCWLDCHRGQQLLPLDTGPPCSERDLTECMHARDTGWLYSPDRKKRAPAGEVPPDSAFCLKAKQNEANEQVRGATLCKESRKQTKLPLRLPRQQKSTFLIIYSLRRSESCCVKSLEKELSHSKGGVDGANVKVPLLPCFDSINWSLQKINFNTFAKTMK